MNIKTVTTSNLGASYQGEMFIKVSTYQDFLSSKTFIDQNNLICFVEGSNLIYAQGHEYSGITSEQAQQIAQISSLQSQVNAINDELDISSDPASIIGPLSYSVNNNGQQETLTASNVTSYVQAVIAAVQSGSADIGNQISNLQDAIDDINDMLDGFPYDDNGTDQDVKTYIDDQLSTAVSQLALAIANNATIVTGDNNHISVSYVATVDQVDPNTGEPTSYKAPFTFRVSGNDIASDTTLQGLISRVNSIFGEGVNTSIDTVISNKVAELLIPENAQASLDTLQEIAAWIQSHPDSASAMNSAISALQSDVSDIQDDISDIQDDYVEKGSIYEPDGQGGQQLKTMTNGTTYAETLEEVNIILGQISYAQNVEDNAEQNVIVGINADSQSVSIKNQTVSFDDGEGGLINSIELIAANYDSNNRTISLGLNTDALETILDKTVDISVNNAVTEANNYTDTRLTWIVVDNEPSGNQGNQGNQGEQGNQGNQGE